MNVFRAGAIYAAANAVSAAVPFLLLPLLTRVLGPEEYGQVIAFSMLVMVCLPFAGLNVHPAVSLRWFTHSRQEMSDFVGAALCVGIVSTIGAAVLAASILSVWPHLLGGALGGIWGAVAALTAGANVLLQCRLLLWQSQQKAVQNAAMQIAASFLNVGLSLVAVVGLAWGGNGRNVAIAASTIIMATMACYLLYRAGDARWSMKRGHAQELVVFGASLVPHVFIGVLLGTTDRWMVSAILGGHALGIYGAGAQLGVIMSLLADAFVKAYSPWLNSKLASGEADDKYLVVGAIYATIPTFFAIAASLGAALLLLGVILLGPSFGAAVGILPWFMLGGAFSGVYMSTSSIFFFFQRTWLLAAVLLTAALIGTLVTWLLIVRFGIVGAAMGYATTQGLLALTSTIIAMRTFDLPWHEATKSLKLCGRRFFST